MIQRQPAGQHRRTGVRHPRQTTRPQQLVADTEPVPVGVASQRQLRPQRATLTPHPRFFPRGQRIRSDDTQAGLLGLQREHHLLALVRGQGSVVDRRQLIDQTMQPAHQIRHRNHAPIMNKGCDREGR